MSWSPLIAFHAVAASLALVLGAFNLLRSRRGDPLHRSVGYAWVALMYAAAVSSFWIQDIREGRFNLLHALSLFTIGTVTLGVASAIRGRVKTHRGLMRGSYYGLLGAFLGAVAVPDRLIPQLALGDPVLFAVMVTAIVGAGVASIVILRIARRAARSGVRP